jgi:hypothetical protein
VTGLDGVPGALRRGLEQRVDHLGQVDDLGLDPVEGTPVVGVRGERHHVRRVETAEA